MLLGTERDFQEDAKVNIKQQFKFDAMGEVLTDEESLHHVW